MATHGATQVTVTQIGSYFVQKYYQVFQQQRDHVHQFYTDESSMISVDGDIVHSANDMMINGSLERKAIRELMARGLIRMVSSHSSQ